MAADTRPYKSKEQDGQGNEVIIRDQQLVEQSTVTTMPSGACFETLDIDGRPVKIPRDNMMSIVLECIGIVLNDSSKNLGTNVNKALGLQGNTIGNVTVNDFASVLGGVNPILLTSSDDLNNILDVSKTYITDTNINPANVPNVENIYNNIIKVFTQGDFVAGGDNHRYVQVLYCINKETFYIRIQKGTQWYGWKEFTGTYV